MRIMIFAAGGDIGGGKTHILSLAKELSELNSLRLVCFRKAQLSKEAAQLGIDTVEIDHKLGIFNALKAALCQYDEFKPDIVHCHGAKANLMGMAVKSLRKACVISTVHSDPKLDYMGKPFKALTNGNINMFALKHMDAHIAVADRMCNLLIETGFDPYNIFTIYNGLDFADASESFYRPQKDVINIGIAARLNPVKDIPTLLKAFAMAFEKDKRLRLSIAGTGEDGEKLRAMASELGISEYVSFDGWISDIKTYFENIDINVLSSVSETFPYSILEGAYVHCPVIASNVGGIPALVEDGVTGYLFEPGDAEHFSELILKLASDAELRKTMGDRLFERARDRFSLKRMVQDQQKFYETLQARKSAPAKYGAVLCGAYGRGNSGDEAILKAIVRKLRINDPDMPIWVMSRNPVQTSKSEHVRGIFIFNLFKFNRAFRQASLFVNGGGSLIQDVTSSRSLYFYLYTLLAAKKRGCRVLMYGCGIGPILKPVDKKQAGRVLNSCADIITLRDAVSTELLAEIGVTKPEIILAADPVFSLPAASQEQVDGAFDVESIPQNGKLIGFCLRDWQGFENKEAVAEAASYANEKYGLVPIFLPIETPKDLAVSRTLAEMTACNAYVVEKQHSAAVLIGMLGRMEAVCGMRLHSLIFATAGGAPVAGISYDVKVDSFMKDIGSQDTCIPLEKLSAEALKACIDAALERGRDGGAEIRSRLVEREYENGRAVCKLIGGNI